MMFRDENCTVADIVEFLQTLEQNKRFVFVDPDTSWEVLFSIEENEKGEIVITGHYHDE